MKRTYSIKGNAMLMHNARLADFRDPLTAELKKLTKKKNKTEEEMKKIAEIEWIGGLYLNSKGHPIIPIDLIEASLQVAGRKTKEGELVKAFVRCMDDATLQYDGPNHFSELKNDPRFCFTKLVGAQGMGSKKTKVLRCRPLFRDWGAKFTLEFDSDGINQKALDDIVTTAGRRCGLGDWRPKFGLFQVIKVE